MSALAVCRLCVNDCTDYKSLYSGYGRGNELHRLTLKYFHPELVNMDESTHLTVICSKCFSSIYDFHSFQTSVSVAQLKLVDYRSVSHVKIENEKVVPQRCGKSPVATVKKKAAFSMKGDKGNLNGTRVEHFSIEDSNDSMETTICPMVHVNRNASDGQLVNTPAARKGAETTRKSLRNKVYAETSATMEEPLPDSSVPEEWEDSAAKDESFTDGDQTMPEYNWPECILDATMGSMENEENCTATLAAGTSPSPSKMNKASLELYVHYDEDDNKFKCLICGHLFSFKHHLLKHIHIRHPIGKLDDSSILSEAKQCYECDMCPCSYTLKRNLQKHQQKEHPLVHGPKPLAATASTSRMATVKASLALAFDMNTRKYKCVLCANLFKKKENVQRHMATKHKNHQGNTHTLDFVYDKSLKKYKCGVCDGTYQYEGNILVHMKREHGQIRIMPEMNFPCPQCTTGFNSQRGLNRHLVSVHNTPVVYACTDCDRTFANQRKFKYHRTTHNKVQLSPKSKKQQKQMKKAAMAAANAEADD